MVYRPRGPGTTVRRRQVQQLAGLTVAVLLAAGSAWGDVKSPSAGRIEYNRDIRPILSDKCFACHGPDEPRRKAKLRLDIPDGILGTGASGARAVVPGDLEESELYRRITADDISERMPPVKHAKPLTPDEIERLKVWIEAGAPYQRHWAFSPPARPEIPAVRERAWCANPIDEFVLARLDQEGLKPSTEADKTTLIRRLSLDLTGLVPTIAEVDAFLADDNPGAYDRLVDRLLCSPHYGERWGQLWLDAARYADSDGFTVDRPRRVWFYRDWVIRAFNNDLPYNRFIIEQIAGDQLPDASQDQIVATGFLRNSMLNEEGGIDPEQFRMEAMFDRMDVIGKSVLGLTIQCAQCHSHKYDPLTHEEYYKIFAFLNNCHEANVAAYTPDEQKGRADLLRRIREIEAGLKCRAPDWRQRMAEWEDRATANQPEWVVVRPEVDEISAEGQKYLPLPDGSLLARGYPAERLRLKMRVKTELKGITGFRLELLNDPNLPLDGPGRSMEGTCALSEFNVVAAPADPNWIEFAYTFGCVDYWAMSARRRVAKAASLLAPALLILLGLQWRRPYPRLRDLSLWPGAMARSAAALGIAFSAVALVSLLFEMKKHPYPVKGKDVRIVRASSDINPPEAILDEKNGVRRMTGAVGFAVDGKEETAWSIDVGPGRSNVPRKAVFSVDRPISYPGGTWLTFSLTQYHGGAKVYYEGNNLGRFRLSLTTAPDPQADPVPADVRAILKVPRDRRTPEQLAAVFRYWRTTVPEWRETNDRIEALWRRHPAGSSQLVLQEREEKRVTHILRRGDFLRPEKAVDPGVPAFLHPFPHGAPPTRLTFAQWLVDRNSPTTARALVNRVWQAYFGTGLVRTSDDFGLQGETPSHPGLLDWLAVEFMDQGWSLKSLHRLIVTSASYRQSSRPTPELLAKDPHNRLLARGPRFRIDGEIVRDIALCASGRLSPKVGGPSVCPPAPDFLFKPPASCRDKVWHEETGEDRYRRALYTFRYRSVPYPALQAFDAPSGESSCVRRPRSNTPLQALVTLNEPVFLECARSLALQTLKEEGDSDAIRVVYVFRRCLARSPTAQESAELLGLLRRQVERFSAEGARPWDLAADRPDQPPPLPGRATPAELAAWTAVCRVLLNLDETITKD